MRDSTTTFITAAGLPTFANSNFASPNESNNYVYYSSMSPTQKTNFAWNSLGGSAVVIGGVWGFSSYNPTGTSGGQLCGLQGAGQGISQTLNFPNPGTYNLTYYVEGRPNGNFGLPYAIEVDGTTVPNGSFAAPGHSAWSVVNLTLPILTAGPHTVLIATGTASGDQTDGFSGFAFTSGTEGISALPATTPVSINSGATLDLNGASQTVASLSNNGGGGTVTNSSTAAAALTLRAVRRFDYLQWCDSGRRRRRRPFPRHERQRLPEPSPARAPIRAPRTSAAATWSSAARWATRPSPSPAA